MSLYDQEHIRRFYNKYAELETTRWEKSLVEQVKLLVHQHYLHQHIKQGDTILELGAGTGIFTKLLAQYSKQLIVTDLSPVQLKLNQQKAEKEQYANQIASWNLADICDLRDYASNSFDKICCYGGPLSYVFDKKQVALNEMKRVLKPNGIALLSVMNLWGTTHQYLTKIMLEVAPEMNERIMQTGNLHPSAFTTSDHHCHMFTAEELKTDIAAVGLELVTISASNCLSALRADELAEIKENEEKWAYFLDLEIRACTSPGMIESGTHLIVVVRKSNNEAKE